MKTEQNLTEFNRRVQHLHAHSGLTWAEIAGALEVSRTMLHYYRRGQHPPDAGILLRLQRAEERAGIAVPTARDYPLPGDGKPMDGDRQLRWLRGLLGQQRETVASAQRHLEEIEGWITEAEAKINLTQGKDDAAPKPAPPKPAPAPARRKEKRARLKVGAPLHLLRDIETVSLPIFGHLPAGWPQTREGVASQRPARRVTVKRGRFPEGSFGLEVRGESMNAAAPTPILDRDTVVLLPPEQREPRHGDIVAALIDGETCLKRLVNKPRSRGAHLRSESTNPSYKEIYPAHDLVIQGVFIGKL